MEKQTLQHIAGTWRNQNGNQTAISKISNIGRHKEIKADDIKSEIIRQSYINKRRIATRERVTERELLKKRFVSKLEAIAKAIPSDGYSMGSVYHALCSMG